MTFLPVLDWHLNIRYRPDEARQHLGRIPLLLDPNCADPVWQQVQDNYPQGWQPVMGEERSKWTFTADEYLVYAGLAPLAPVAFAYLRSERVLVYPAGWVVVSEPEGTFTVARILP